MKFVDANGVIAQAKRFANAAPSISEDGDIAKTVRALGQRVTEIESRVGPEGIEFEVNVGISGALTTMNHNFNGPVRWWLTTWVQQDGVTYPINAPILLQDASSDSNNLVLRSHVAGRAVVRIEPAPASIDPGVTVVNAGSPGTTTVTMGGDVTGLSSTAVVAKVNGITVTGTPAAGAVLRATSSSAAAWGQLDLADTDAVTGVLPTGNQATQGAQAMGGDVSGTTAAAVVAKVNGITVTGTPAAGSILRATSTSAASWGQADLADTDALTGVLPIVNGGWGYATKAEARLTPLDANHLHAWELDDASGGFADTGSSTSKVTITATTAGNVPLYLQTPGPVGASAVFGRSVSGATVTSNGSVLVSSFSDLPLTNFTLEIWFRSEKPVPGAIMGADCVGADNIFVSRGASEGLGASVRATAFTNITSTTGGAYVNPGVWHHHALVYDTANSLMILYLDGHVIARSSQTGNAQWTNGTTPKMWIAGTQNSAGQFLGQLARFRISNIARSQSYLQDVYKRAMLY